MNSLKGVKPMLPVWLSPTQVRFIPINEDMVSHCQEMASRMQRIRADIDDRSESLGKRIRAAEKEWVPYIIVVGEKEVSTGKLPVRIRATGEQANMDLDELISEVSSKMEGLPYRGLPLPFFLSKRARFR
jgi:threonyl-tRNA synthetase